MKITISSSVYRLFFSFFLLCSLFLSNNFLYAKEPKVNVSVPEEAAAETDTQFEKNNWYIYYKNAKKITAGPFETVEEVIDEWLGNKKIKSGGKYYIGRNNVLFTNKPENYYKTKYQEVLAKRENKEAEEASLVPEGADSSEENVMVSQEESSGQNIQETKEPVSYSESSEYVPWTPEPDLFSSSNRYEKKYLSDYVKNDEFVIPANPETDRNLNIAEEYADEINLTDSKGVTSLMKAVKDSNDWKIKNLIQAGASVNAKDKDGWTALMYAVRYQNNLSVLNLLIDAGADVKAQNNFSVSALIIAACYNNNPDILKRIISFYSPSDKEVQKAFVQLVSTQTSDNLALYSKASLFLDFGLPVNSYYDGKTPLMYACKYCKSTRVIKLLIDKDASLSLRSTEGKTAFDYARENKLLPKDEVYWALNKR